MHVARGTEFAEKIKQACRRSGSVFHATGVNPTLIPDQVMLSLTGLANDLRSTTLQKFWDTSNNSRETAPRSRRHATVRQPMRARETSSDRACTLGLRSWA